MSELDPPGGPDRELEAFYAAERARASVPDAARHAALARVLAAGPVPVPLPPPPGVGRGAAAAAALATLALGVVIGAAGHAAWVGDPAVAPVVEVPAAPVAIPPVIPETVTEPSVAPVVEPEPVTAEAVPPSSPTHPDEPEGEAGLAGEMALVARAQTALQRGLFSSALSALDEHARRFPRGELAEEREALAVQALARAGRHDDAARRAERFGARYPRSLLGPVVRAAVEGGARELEPSERDLAPPARDGEPR